MPTDWKLIRELMASVIDSCEQIEAAGYTEQDRHLTVDVSGQKVTVQDIMTSAWTLPENLRYQIIRERRNMGADLPYTPEVARVLVKMAEACSELVGAGEVKPAETEVRSAIQWYRTHAIPQIQRAIANARAAT